MLAVVWGRRVADSGQILQFLRALKAPKTVPKEKKIVLVLASLQWAKDSVHKS